MKRPSDPSPPEYSGPSILSAIPKDVLTSLILRDWGNFSIADLLRFCNTSKDAQTRCNEIWTRFFKERCDVKIVEKAMENLPLAFPRFIANEMLFTGFKPVDSFGRKWFMIQDGKYPSLSFSANPAKISKYEMNRMGVDGSTVIWCRFFGFITNKDGSISEARTRSRENAILKAMGKWYTIIEQPARTYMIPYTTYFDVLEIFYNWVVFNLSSPMIYHTPFDQLDECITCGNPATLQEKNGIFCNVKCQAQFYNNQ